MKPIKYEDAIAQVSAGKITFAKLLEMQAAGFVGPSPTDLRLRDVPEDLRPEYKALLESAEKLTEKLPGQYVRIQLAKVK